MNIKTGSIVSNSEIIKNYKTCREKADQLGKIFIFKNNQPDAVLFSIAEYGRLSVLIEYLQNLEENEIEELVNHLPKSMDGGTYLIDIFKNDLTSSIKHDDKK